MRMIRRRGMPAWASSRLARSAIRLFTANITILAIIVTAVSATAKTSTGGEREFSASITIGRLEPGNGQARPASIPASCKPALADYDRTEACWPDAITLPVYIRGKGQVGSIAFSIIQSMHLKAIGRDFTEDFLIYAVQDSGTVPPYMLITLKASCGSPCRATVHLPKHSLLAPGTSGTISYSDAIGSGKMHSTRTSYELDYTPPPGWTSLGPTRWKTPLYYRCDDKFKNRGAGCVFPRFSPTLTSMTTLPHVARNIHLAQQGPGHYGRPGSKHPLHYLADKAKQDANRNAVCGPRVVGKPPKGQSCDEYPFATTYEGGTAVSKANRRVAWVPKEEQDKQGGLLSAFYGANRILDRDAFWVKA